MLLFNSKCCVAARAAPVSHICCSWSCTCLRWIQAWIPEPTSTVCLICNHFIQCVVRRAMPLSFPCALGPCRAHSNMALALYVSPRLNCLRPLSRPQALWEYTLDGKLLRRIDTKWLNDPESELTIE